MAGFVFRKIGHGVLVLAGVVVIVFFIFHAIPGDPVSLLAGQRSDIATRSAIEEELGLHLPLHRQFLLYLNDISPVGVHERSPAAREKYQYWTLVPVGASQVLALKAPYLRRSFQTNQLVGALIVKNVINTFWLAAAAMVFATLFGILFGVIAAVHPNGFWDHFLITLSVAGISVPSFVSAIFIALIFGYYLSDFTGLNLTGHLWVNHPVRGRELHLENLILPAFTLGIRPLAMITQLTRNAMRDVLTSEYIRSAYAMGLPRNTIIFKYALKNAMNPVATAASGWLASLMAGAFFVEYIFDWKGLGYLTIKAVQNLDFPVVMGSTIVIGTFFVVINILVDIVYALADPRVRLT
jgi:peptide/nickel transport system permease protein